MRETLCVPSSSADSLEACGYDVGVVCPFDWKSASCEEGLGAALGCEGLELGEGLF